MIVEMEKLDYVNNLIVLTIFDLNQGWSKIQPIFLHVLILCIKPTQPLQMVLRLILFE